MVFSFFLRTPDCSFNFVDVTSVQHWCFFCNIMLWINYASRTFTFHHPFRQRPHIQIRLLQAVQQTLQPFFVCFSQQLLWTCSKAMSLWCVYALYPEVTSDLGMPKTLPDGWEHRSAEKNPVCTHLKKASRICFELNVAWNEWQQMELGSQHQSRQ